MMNSSRGFAIVEVVIAASILLIMALAVTQLLGSQAKEINRLKAKLEINDLQVELSRLMVDGNQCLHNFQAQPIDATQIANPSFSVPVTAISRLPTPAHPTPPLVLEGPVAGVTKRISQLTVPVDVKSMGLGNWRDLSPDLYGADLVVEFETHLGRILPVVIRGMRFVTNPASPPNAKQITSCYAPAGAFAGGALAGGASSAAMDCVESTIEPGVFDPGTGPQQRECAVGEIRGAAGATCMVNLGWGWVESGSTTVGLHVNKPITHPDGRQGWRADCFGPDLANDTARAVITLTCCRAL